MTQWKDRVKAAESAYVLRLQDKLVAAGPETIDAAKYLLERKAGEDFGNRQRVQVEEVKPLKVLIKTYAAKVKAAPGRCARTRAKVNG